MGEKKPVSRPSDISFSGWKEIILSVKDEIANDNVTIVSAGVAFYSFLAIFPALTALISIYGLAFNPEQIQDQIMQLASVMPDEALQILEQQLESFQSTSGKTLGWGVAIGIALSLWSANKGTTSLFTGLDIAYGVKNTRGIIKQNALSLLFTLGAIIVVILSMIMIVAFPAFVGYLGLPTQVENLIGLLRWVLLAVIIITSFSLVYKYAPARPIPRSRWVRVGATIATLLWLIASWGFSFYVSNFGNYGEVYGSISAVVVMLMWLFITSLIILLGAEINSEIRNYAKKDLKMAFKGREDSRNQDS